MNQDQLEIEGWRGLNLSKIKKIMCKGDKIALIYNEIDNTVVVYRYENYKGVPK